MGKVVIAITVLVTVGILWFAAKQPQDGQGAVSSDTLPFPGEQFPDFSVTEVDGRVITADALKGKPAIVWFTTEFCVPCQIGAREVSKLDDELGGSAFDVLVIFVDPRETEEDLKSWRERFAREDWMVAFDNFQEGPNSLSAKVGLKYLDSKYLLNKEGILQNIDFQIADESYLNLVRNVVSQ